MQISVCTFVSSGTLTLGSFSPPFQLCLVLTLCAALWVSDARPAASYLPWPRTRPQRSSKSGFLKTPKDWVSLNLCMVTSSWWLDLPWWRIWNGQRQASGAESMTSDGPHSAAGPGASPASARARSRPRRLAALPPLRSPELPLPVCFPEGSAVVLEPSQKRCILRKKGWRLMF